MREAFHVIAAATDGIGLLGAGYAGLVTGAMAADLGIGRRVRPPGPSSIEIDAARDVGLGLMAVPYLGRQSRTMTEKIRTLEQGSDMKPAPHCTAARTCRPRSPSKPLTVSASPCRTDNLRASRYLNSTARASK